MRQYAHLWLFFGLFCMTLGGCMQGYDFTIDYRNRFFERLKSFEHKRAQIKSSFSIVFESLEMKLQSPKPNFRNISWEWTSRLDALEHQVEGLQKELVKMDTLSKFFYRQLKDMNNKMKDTTIKTREKRANEVHEKEWKKQRAYAKRNMDRIRKVIEMGRDAHKVFVSSGIRTKRETALQAMREVRHELFSNVRRLEKFAHATELLMSLEREDLIPDEIKNMEERREVVVKKLDKISRIMHRQLKEKGKNLQEISWQWESNYMDMRYELEALSDDFENIKTLTKAYQDKSAYHIEKIVMPDIRDKENETQKAHQAKLDKIYEKIAKIREDITQNFRFADDTYQVLINSARRRQTTEAIESLTNIKTKISDSLVDLKNTLNGLLALFTLKKQK